MLRNTSCAESLTELGYNAAQNCKNIVDGFEHPLPEIF